MLVAKPSSFLSQDFALTWNGQGLGTLDQASFRERATLVLEGTPYTFGRHLLQRSYTLERAGQPVAQAKREGVFKRIFEITTDEALAGAAPMALRMQQRRSFPSLSHRFEVATGRDVIGIIRRPNLFGRQVQADLPPTLPLPLQVFLLWIALMMWKRDDSSGGD